MKNTVVALVCLLVLACGCDPIKSYLGLEKPEPAPTKTPAEIWQERLAQVHPGMARREVEALLPVYPQGPLKRSLQDQSQFITYWLDGNWKVTLEYDFSGLPADQAGKTAYDSPENKLLAPPTLKQQRL